VFFDIQFPRQGLPHRSFTPRSLLFLLQFTQLSLGFAEHRFKVEEVLDLHQNVGRRWFRTTGERSGSLVHVSLKSDGTSANLFVVGDELRRLGVVTDNGVTEYVFHSLAYVFFEADEGEGCVNFAWGIVLCSGELLDLL